jgi:hypothetical protein
VAQFFNIDIARAHHRRCVLIIGQRKEQMLGLRVFVPPFFGDRDRLT